MKLNLSKLFARKIVLFGKAVPVAAIALGIATFGAAAWLSIFLFQTRFAVSTTPALLAPVPVGSWSCTKVSGTGAAIDTCATLAGSNGPEVVISGLSEDDLYVYAYREYTNGNAVPMTLTLQGGQNPVLPVTIQTGGGAPLASLTLAPAETANVFIGIRSAGIGPNMALNLTGLEMRWAP